MATVYPKPLHEELMLPESFQVRQHLHGAAWYDARRLRGRRYYRDHAFYVLRVLQVSVISNEIDNVNGGL